MYMCMCVCVCVCVFLIIILLEYNWFVKSCLLENWHSPVLRVWTVWTLASLAIWRAIACCERLFPPLPKPFGTTLHKYYYNFELLIKSKYVYTIDQWVGSLGYFRCCNKWVNQNCKKKKKKLKNTENLPK